MQPDYKSAFSRFLNAVPGRLHFAAHSHHFWPDVTFDAHMQAWTDAAAGADKKWGRVFGEVIPAVRQGIADTLNLPDPSSICFAPNTHEFVLRLLSCFDARQPVRILTTDSEFYSFRRQTQRLAEDGLVQVNRIATEPFDTFVDRFCAEAASGAYDLVFTSQVFFNSGFALSSSAMERIVQSCTSDKTIVVFDGYHGFMAVPTDLSRIAHRVFYLAGGYKYAMSGEGACFMHCPPGYGLRPRNTGWFAEMDSLAAEKGASVDYAEGGDRFYGATFDPSGLYRMRAVFEWIHSAGLNVEKIHRHVHDVQQYFVSVMPADILDERSLVVPISCVDRGHFLTFRRADAGKMEEKLYERQVMTDCRGDRLRFGFSIYHDKSDVDKLAAILKEMT